MKANNLTISIPYKGCNKDCPYCISKLTGHIHSSDEELMRWNIEKVKTLANNASINSVLITGKGEPLLNMSAVEYFGKQFNHYPLEIQTNGIILDNEIISDLQFWGYDIISISVDNDTNIEKTIKDINIINNEFNMVSRISIVVEKPSQFLSDVYGEKSNIESRFLSRLGAHQYIFRNLTYPTKGKSKKEGTTHSPQEYDVMNYIDTHSDYSSYFNLYHYFKENARVIRTTPFGIEIFSYKGYSIAFSDYCIQEEVDDEIRSLIFLENGHVYTSWNDVATLII